ncbi:Gti1/Pac2 family-domain-containing protein [Cristinia sonorae]|uniref:Gti1/Pac2 family-domain-containing protein n=1 Tax=Cristinia sonorae TaxID=1940300 RepID=A0A8K0UWC3_9AGAR|nr:Gti1/Pac2 family-domain-containing protein [Cristinia sonorae]
MSDHQPSSSNAPASSWTEPPWSGWIETTGDALLILEAARRGLIPRVTRRLVDSERKMITSGSVFVFDEDESGIRRWTDGFFWSPSRILGNFLLYRETEKRGAGHRSARAEREAQTEEYTVDGVKMEGQSLSRPKADTSRLGIDRLRERSLVGSLTNSYKFKPGGMMKKTFSLTIAGVAQHLISYYKIEDVEQGRLRSPSSLPELASLDISPEYLDKTHFRNPPKVEIGVDGVPRYRGEADDIDNSPHLIPAPLSALPYDEPSTQSGKRGKRYDPYSQGTSTPKRRKPKAVTASASQESADAGSSTQSYPPPPALQQPAPTYADPSLSSTTTPQYQYPYYPIHPGYHLPAPVYSPGPAPAAPYASAPPPVTTGSPIQPQDTPSPPAGSRPSPTHPPPPASLPYPPYAPAEASQSMYPYYPPHSYAPYPSVPWSGHYPSYPAHGHPHPQPAGAVMGSHDVTGVGGEDGGRGHADGPAGGT